jgi:competence protein ComEC
MILTHPHKDHVAGLNYVLESYDVRQILHTGVSCDLGDYESFLKNAREKEIDILNSSFIDDIILGEDCALAIIYPKRDLEGARVSNLNNTSIVSRLDCGGESYLFTGDIEEGAEQEILDMGVNIDSDILKVAHHGSDTSSIKDFLEEVSPLVSVVSVGEESPDNPDGAVLERLRAAGSKIEFTYNY